MNTQLTYPLRFIAGLLVVTLISLIVYGGPLLNGLNVSDMPWLPWTQEAQAEGDIWQPITITVTVIGVALLVAYYSAKLKSYKCDECNEKISSSESHITICDGCNKLYQNASCSSSTDEEIENHRQTTCTKCNETYYMCGSIDGGPAGSLHTWHQEGNC